MPSQLKFSSHFDLNFSCSSFQLFEPLIRLLRERVTLWLSIYLYIYLSVYLPIFHFLYMLLVHISFSSRGAQPSDVFPESNHITSQPFFCYDKQDKLLHACSARTIFPISSRCQLYPCTSLNFQTWVNRVSR